MTTAGHELALCIINDNNHDYGTDYEMRCAIARQNRAVMRAHAWLSNARTAAYRYTKVFGTTGDKLEDIFTDEDILSCAAEIASYYANHIKEIDALETA